MGGLTSPKTYAALAAFQAGDAVACAIPVPPIARALDTLGVPQNIRWLLPASKAASVVGLLAADHQLIVLDRDRQIGHREAGDGQRDAQRVVADLLDIVGRIAVGGALVDAIERPLEMLEPEQQRRVEQRHARHGDLLIRARGAERRASSGPRAAPECLISGWC